MLEQTMKEKTIKIFEDENELFDEISEINDVLYLLFTDGDYMDEIGIFISFNSLDDIVMVNIAGTEIFDFSHNLAAGYKICNQLNNDEIFKFNIDTTNQVEISADFIFNAESVEEESPYRQILSAANMLAVCIDEVYPLLEKAAHS